MFMNCHIVKLTKNIIACVVVFVDSKICGGAVPISIEEIAYNAVAIVWNTQDQFVKVCTESYHDCYVALTYVLTFILLM